MESGRLRPQENSDVRSRESGPGSKEIPVFYRGGRQDLGQAQRSLLQIRQEIGENGGLHLNEMKDSITEVFGAQFFKSLSDWAPKNTAAILAGEAIAAHAKKLQMDLLPEQVTLPVLAERARWDMAMKLIDQELQHIADLRVLLDNPSATAQQETGLDTFNRYITSAARELELLSLGTSTFDKR